MIRDERLHQVACLLHCLIKTAVVGREEIFATQRKKDLFAHVAFQDFAHALGLLGQLCWMQDSRPFANHTAVLQALAPVCDFVRVGLVGEFALEPLVDQRVGRRGHPQEAHARQEDAVFVRTHLDNVFWRGIDLRAADAEEDQEGEKAYKERSDSLQILAQDAAIQSLDASIEGAVCAIQPQNVLGQILAIA